ncbi:MAG: c-type cytochrome [Chitinophagaceae bacterium]
MKVLKVTGIILLVILVGILGVVMYVKIALPNVGPAADITIERTPQRIERGKYLAHSVAVCMDCHSTRDWTHYAGPMTSGLGAGGEVFNREMGFPGNFYAPNITPYALASWTDGEIVRAVTTGVNKSGKALFPLMGYHRFGHMDEEDIHSIVAYIRTLPAIKKDIPRSEPDFPVNILINTMPEKAAFSKMPAQEDVTAYGKYLINVSGCVECHSKTDKGQVVPGTEFGGGMEFHQPAGVMRSPNITSDIETGIGKWTSSSFVQRFRMYADSSYHGKSVAATELNTPMPWTMYSGMSEKDLAAIYTYLTTVTPIKNQVIRAEYTAGKDK